MKLGWSLLRPDVDPPRKKLKLPQLAATNVQQLGDDLDCFPDSPLVVASLKAAMEAMWGAEWLFHDDPGTVPPAATTKPQKWVHDFKKKFYVDTHVQEVPVSATKFTAEELNLLKRGTSPGKINVPLDDLAAIETIARHSLLALGSVDWLFGTVRKLLMDPIRDEILIQQAWAAALRALRHATQFSAATVASCTINRRKAFLNECDEDKVPKHARNWLQFQPLPDNQETMFNSCLPKVRTMAQAESQSKLLAMATKPSRSYTPSAKRPFRSDNVSPRDNFRSFRGRRGSQRGGRRGSSYNSYSTRTASKK